MPFKQEKREGGSFSQLTKWLNGKNDSTVEQSLLHEISGLFSHLSPQALTKIVSFDEKFKTVVTKIEDQREEEYLSALARKVQNSGQKVGFLRKIINQGKKLLQRQEDELTAFLRKEGPYLTQLDLSVESVSLDNTDAFIEEMVHYCPNLVTLNANGCKISAKSIETLKKLSNLEAISFSFCEIEDPEIIAKIATFSKLRDLRLSWNKKLPLATICELSKLAPTLELLDLSHTNVTDEELMGLAGLCHLKTLKIRDLKKITGKSLCTFSCTDLINLDIVLISRINDKISPNPSIVGSIEIFDGFFDGRIIGK